MDPILELIHWLAQPDNNLQKLAYKRAQQFSQDPNFLLSLARLFVSPEHSPDFRFKAAVILKAAIRSIPTLSEDLHSVLLKADTQNPLLRQAFVILIPEVAVRSGLKNSHNLIEYLVALLDTEPVLATDCFAKIIEDLRFNQENLNFYDSSQGLNLIDSLVARFLQLVHTDNSQVAANCLHFLNYNVYFMPPALAQSVDTYISLLVAGCSSQIAQIRLKSLQGLHALIETKRDRIRNHDMVIQCCVRTIKDTEPDVAKYAELYLTDFLRIDDESDMYQAQFLKPYLQHIIPTVLLNLQSTHQDQQNIMPSLPTVYQQNGDEDEEQEAQPVGEYTLRKVSEQLFEMLLQYFDQDVVSVTLPFVQELMQQADWHKKEIGLLALGLMANQLMNLTPQHVPSIMALLFSEALRTNEFIYSTILWAISCYHKYLKQEQAAVILNYLRLLIQSIENPSLIIKEAACASLNALAQEAFDILKPYLLDLFQVFLKGLEQGTNIQLQMYQSLCALLQGCESIDNPAVADLIFSNLVAKLKLMSPSDYNICPVYECLQAAVERCAQLSMPYVPVLFESVRNSIAAYVSIVKSNNARQTYQIKEILKRAIDLCANILIQAKEQFVNLVDPSFLMNIDIAIQDPETDVRQYILSLLGELVKNCYSIVQHTNLGGILNENIHSRSVFSDPAQTYLATSNNACWALGELAAKDPQKVALVFDEVANKMTQILNDKKLPRPIAQNFAVAFCRLMEADLARAQPYIQATFKRIALILSQSKGKGFEEYRQQSLRLLVRIVQAYPQLILPDFKYFVYCMVVSDPLQDTSNEFATILADFKQSVGEKQFDAIFTSPDFPGGFREKLHQCYNA